MKIFEVKRKKDQPVLVEVGINGGNGRGFEKKRSREVREAFGEVDSIAFLCKV